MKEIGLKLVRLQRQLRPMRIHICEFCSNHHKDVQGNLASKARIGDPKHVIHLR